MTGFALLLLSCSIPWSAAWWSGAFGGREHRRPGRFARRERRASYVRRLERKLLDSDR